MIEKEEFEELMKHPLFKKLIDNFTHQEKEIKGLRKELNEINKLLNEELSLKLENIIKDKFDNILNTLKNKPSFESVN